MHRRKLKTHKPFTSSELRDPTLVVDTLLECIKSGDLETFQEVLIAHLMPVNKTELARKAGIARRTLYDMLDLNKKFNPEFSTVLALVRVLSHLPH
jgi:DNA-binding phage protein